MADDELVVKIKVDSTEFADKLSKSQEEVKKFGDQIKTSSTESAESFKDSADKMNRSQEETKESSDKVSKSMVDQGREIRTAGREFALANIEWVQANQNLTMIGNTAEKWGNQLQGSTNILNNALGTFKKKIDDATGGMTNYIGAAVSFIGKAIDMEAQYQRLAFWAARNAAEEAVNATAIRDTAIATGELAVAQGGLNVAHGSKSFAGAAGIIGGIVMAVGLAVSAFDGYTKSLEDSKRKQEELSGAVKATTKAIEEQLYGQTDATKDLKKQMQEKTDQQIELTEKEAIARELGYEAEAESFYQQHAKVDKELEILTERYNRSIARGPDPSVLSKEYGKLAKIAADEYYKEFSNQWSLKHRGIEIWGKEKERIKADSVEFGDGCAQAYVDGLKRGLTSDKARAEYEAALKKLHEPVKAESPPKVGPLRDIGLWGERLGITYAEGFEKSSSYMNAASTRFSQSAAQRISNSNTSNYNSHDNRNYNIAPTIQVINNVDLNDPQIKMDIARAVSQEVRRMVAVS